MGRPSRGGPFPVRLSLETNVVFLRRREPKVTGVAHRKLGSCLRRSTTEVTTQAASVFASGRNGATTAIARAIQACFSPTGAT